MHITYIYNYWVYIDRTYIQLGVQSDGAKYMQWFKSTIMPGTMRLDRWSMPYLDINANRSVMQSVIKVLRTGSILKDRDCNIACGWFTFVPGKSIMKLNQLALSTIRPACGAIRSIMLVWKILYGAPWFFCLVYSLLLNMYVLHQNLNLKYAHIYIYTYISIFYLGF